MYTVFLAGGIGSGKSTVARELELLGAYRIDLDQLSREVLAPGSDVTRQVAQAFGADLIDQDSGELNRRLLAERAFASRESAELLEAIELPAIRNILKDRLEALATSDHAPTLCVVEVPLLDRVADPLGLANEVVVVSCPRELRRQRAIERGMTGEDFDARAANQPSDEWLRAHATTVMDNEGTAEQLRSLVHAWHEERLSETDA